MYTAEVSPELKDALTVFSFFFPRNEEEGILYIFPIASTRE